MPTKLIVVVVVVPLYRSVLDRAVHPFNLAVGPRMIGLSERIDDLTRQILKIARQNDVARRLMTMSRIGPATVHRYVLSKKAIKNKAVVG